MAMTTRFLKPVHIDKGEVLLRSRLKERENREVHLTVELFDKEGILCSLGEVTYVAFPESFARRQLAYPGIEKFFE
jgi:acyl-CoA thioesterase FadM